jgi:hypothetical protein
MLWALWYARIPSSSYLTDMLALVCGASVAQEPKKPARVAENTSQPDRDRANRVGARYWQ